VWINNNPPERQDREFFWDLQFLRSLTLDVLRLSSSYTFVNGDL
jgi:hypothetical protein